MLRWSGTYGVAFWITGMIAAAYLLTVIKNSNGGLRHRKVLSGVVLSGMILLVITLGAYVIKLGIPLRFWHLLVYPRFYSPMSVGTWVLLGLFIIFLATWLLIKKPAVRMLTIPGGLLAIFTIIYPAVLLHATDLTLWYITNLLPVIFAATSFATGAAFLITTNWFIYKKVPRDIYKFSMLVTGMNLVIIILFILQLRLSPAWVANQALIDLLGGISGLLLASSIAIGMILPLSGAWFIRKRFNSLGILGIEGMILLGALLERLAFIYGAQI